MNSGRPILWPVIFVILAASSFWNIYRNRLLAAQRTEPDAQGISALKETLRAVRDYELAQTGKILSWPENLEAMGGAMPASASGDGYSLVLAISEVNCDACRDREVQFVLDLARQVRAPILQMVVHAASPRYVRSFMRLNEIDIPVLYDREGLFFKKNRLGDGPLLMLVSPSGEVMAAHWPLTGEPEMCEPFHAMCYRFFGLNPISEG